MVNKYLVVDVHCVWLWWTDVHVMFPQLLGSDIPTGDNTSITVTLKVHRLQGIPRHRPAEVNHTWPNSSVLLATMGLANYSLTILVIPD